MHNTSTGPRGEMSRTLSLAAQIFGVRKEEALPILEDIIGATTFLYEYAAKADLTMTF